jgi:hypothetical protein
MAASLLDRHGDEALGMVSVQIAALHRLVRESLNAEDMALLRFWRQTGEAMLAIVAAKPAGPYGAH